MMLLMVEEVVPILPSENLDRSLEIPKRMNLTFLVMHDLALTNLQNVLLLTFLKLVKSMIVFHSLPYLQMSENILLMNSH